MLITISVLCSSLVFGSSFFGFSSLLFFNLFLRICCGEPSPCFSLIEEPLDERLGVSPPSNSVSSILSVLVSLLICFFCEELCFFFDCLLILFLFCGDC